MGKIAMEMRYGIEDEAGRKKRFKLLSAAAMFLIAGIAFLINLFGVEAYSAVPTTEPVGSTPISQSSMISMLADNIFILLVPFAIVIIIYQSFLLHQIKENVSNRTRGG